MRISRVYANRLLAYLSFLAPIIPDALSSRFELFSEQLQGEECEDSLLAEILTVIEVYILRVPRKRTREELFETTSERTDENDVEEKRKVEKEVIKHARMAAELINTILMQENGNPPRMWRRIK